MEKDKEIVRRQNKRMGVAPKQNVTRLQSSYIENQSVREKALAKRKKGLIRRVLAFSILGLIISYGMISTIISQQAKIEDKVEMKKQLEEEVAKLQQEQVILEEEIVKLNDDEYIAKIARRDYFLSEEGEIIFKIGDEPSSY